MNPLLPPEHCVPDIEARPMPDGRLYLYGSYDISGESFYCSPDLHVFSTENLENWTDHGVVLTAGRTHAPGMERIFAPDCVRVGDAYHLFYCGDDWSEGVATASHPAGPFKNPRPVDGADGDGIDPAVLVDDDGRIFYFWGQFTLRGAELKPDCSGIRPETLRTHVLTEDEHGFHEGASIRKIDGRYVMVYTDISRRGRPTCLAYATADHPLGPYAKRGILIDNHGCDPETWNNHGSIACFRDRWAVFYHRACQGNRHVRRACAEPIAIGPDLEIAEVSMTTRGLGPTLPADQPLVAFRACALAGKLRTRADYPSAPDAPWREYLAYIHHGDRAHFRTLRFGPGLRQLRLTYASPTGHARLQARLDHAHGPLLAACDLPPTGGWHRWTEASADLRFPPEGERELVLCFQGHRGNLANLLTIQFA